MVQRVGVAGIDVNTQVENAGNAVPLGRCPYQFAEHTNIVNMNTDIIMRAKRHTIILRVLVSLNLTQSSPQRGFFRGGVRSDFGE